MSLNDYEFKQDPYEAAHLKLASAKAALEKNKTYELAVEVQLAQREVDNLANERRRLIHEVV